MPENEISWHSNHLIVECDKNPSSAPFSTKWARAFRRVGHFENVQKIQTNLASLRPMEWPSGEYQERQEQRKTIEAVANPLLISVLHLNI